MRPRDRDGTRGQGRDAAREARRRAAFEGRADEGVFGHYLDKVRRHAYRVVDEDVAGLRASGLDDDAIVELTFAAALGVAAERLEAGLALLGRER